MRLTLRTLLAYLDDRLPPSNARELGQKIANSPFATDLVDRIKEVKRKRRLASPDKPQPMIEANLIAEYLDDQLTPEVVAQIEREVLSSDAMLAEVAAAHEVLGMLRDPVTVEPRLRDRLYGLDPTGATDIVRTLGTDMKASIGKPAVESQWKPPKTQGATSSKRLPAIMIVSLGLIWLAVLAFDSDLFGRKQSSAEPAAVNAEDPAGEVVEGRKLADKVAMNEADVAKNDAGGGAADRNEKEIEKGKEIESTPNDDSSTPSPNKLNSDGSPIAANADAAESKPPAAGGNHSNGKTGDAPMVAAETIGDKPGVDSVAAVPTTEPAPPEPAAAAEPAPAYFLQADSRVVMVLNERQNRWYSLAQIPGGDAIVQTRNAVNCFPLLDGNWFGIQEFFPMQLVAESKGWNVKVLGPVLMRLSSVPDGGLDVFHGRLKLTCDRSMAWNDEKRPEFVLASGTVNTLLTLQSQETLVAIEVSPVATISSDVPSPTSPVGAVVPVIPMDGDVQVQIAVLEGALTLRPPGSDIDTTVGKNQRASWTVLDRTTFSSLLVQNIESVLTAPGWYFEQDSEDPPELVKVKSRMLETLKSDHEPGDSVLPLLDDRNVQNGVMAVKLLALTRDIDRLLAILYDPRDEMIHRAAIDGLSSIANSSPVARQAILANLETRLPMPEIEPTMMLILGISSAQAADPRVTTDLIALLGNDRLATRTLAIYRMEQITKDRMGFHPEAEPSRRRDAIRRWQRHIDRNAGQLVP